MDKLRMQTANKADENFRKLAAMFPDAVTETINENGEVVRAIDKDVLMQEISCKVVDGNEERYQFTWPDKKKSVLLANAPINKTLRPVREDETVPTGADSEGKPYCSTGSVDFDTTENLYIEGDNLEVLKLLQETYLGKIKMIYIDPPYNTGNDFVYNDEFGIRNEEWNGISGNYDADGNQIVGALEKNTEANGRFHTDWLNMIYPRLKLAKDLLADDGVIFISIDDNEQVNLSKVCDEIFGPNNRIGPIIQNKQNAKNDTVNIQKNHEFILIYRKSAIIDGAKVKATLSRRVVTYRDVLEENGRFYYLNDPITTRGEGGTLNARPNLGYTIYYNPKTGDFLAKSDYNIQLAKTENNEDIVYHTDTDLIEKGYVTVRPPRVRGQLGCWTWALDKFNAEKHSVVITGKPGSYTARKRTFVDSNCVICKEGKLVYMSAVEANSRSILDFSTNEGTNELSSLIKGNVFNNPKNLDMIKYLISLVQDSNAYVLDFFSGSSTTAHAVMRLNAEDGGHRKFIMVQLPEKCDEKSEAYKAGYKTICEVGKERIRRAGKKIREENTDNSSLLTPNSKLDTGFRVLKCDTSNMKDVYYNPSEYEVNMFSRLEDNIKADRTPEDLLFQVMLDLGILLSSKIQVRSEEVGMRSYSYFDVEDGYLIACFDKNIDEEVITAIAKQKPYYFVMRDSSMANDSVATNFDQIFSTYSPETVRKVL